MKKPQYLHWLFYDESGWQIRLDDYPLYIGLSANAANTLIAKLDGYLGL